jgi:REP-associated tyrosine transposase
MRCARPLGGMARHPRNEVETGVFHVYGRGNEKQDIFRSEADRAIYVRRLGIVTARQQWRCMAYCLMPNHIHLLIETVVPNLGEGMRLLHGAYAQGFNVRHKRVGHLFQGRYGAVPVTDDGQLATTVGYIATNPVAAGLVRRPEDWAWGSHRAMAGDGGAVPVWLARERLRELLAGASGGDGARRYGELVAGRLDGGAGAAAGVTVSTSEITTGAGSGSTVR